MKLLNHTLLYLSASLLIIIGIWAVIFYFSMLDEVYDSIDDGLDNYKMLVIQKSRSDTNVLKKINFDESNYAIESISKETAEKRTERYSDTLMYMQNEEDYEPVRMLSTVFTNDNVAYYQLKIISSMVEEDDMIEDLLLSLIWLYFGIILSIILVNNMVLKRVWKPFYQLIENLRGFNLKNNKVFKSPKTNVTEFKVLNETLLTLLNKNIEIYNSQKQFIENAAHELQTPLAISINKMELMLEKEGIAEEQAEILASVIENLERLTRLNTSLLLLSKIENRQFMEEEKVEFNAVVKKQLNDFSEVLEFKQVKLSLKEEAVFAMDFNKDLAVILLSNLVKNAILHNKQGGGLEIKMAEDALSISNSGEASELDPQKLFQRFYKTSSKNSTGLGLAICKTICDLYGLKLSYSFDGKHHLIIRK